MHSFITNRLPDFPTSPDLLTITGPASIGIELVRQIQNFLAKKPLQSSKNIVVISSAHLLTLPAQNALLKSLEEPPANAEIYLVTSQPHLLLPTILSRCQISNYSDQMQIDSKLNDLIIKLLSLPSVSDRIVLLDAQAFTRESLWDFINAFEIYLHQHLSPSSSPSLYALIIQTRKFLQTNSNLRLLTTYLAIQSVAENSIKQI